MKRTINTLSLSLSLLLVACQTAQFTGSGTPDQLLSPGIGTEQATSAGATARSAPVVIQKSPVLAPVNIKPEGKIQLQGSRVRVELVLPALDSFKTQALDLSGDNATNIIATVTDSHGQSYTPVGAVAGKVAYPANGVLNLVFADVVPDPLLLVELQVEDNDDAHIPQAQLAAVVSQTGTSDVNATINFQTTPTALAMKALINADAERARAINLPDLVSLMASITGVATGPPITYTTHPTLVDTAQLATDLAGSQPGALTAANYRLNGATVNLTVNGLVGDDRIQVDVTDAASVRATEVGASGSIAGATPGNGLKVRVGAEAANSTQYTFAVNPSTVNLSNNTATGVTITATPVAVSITSLTPDFGAIGNTLTLAGTGFSTVAGNNTVRFGSTTATVNSVNGDGTSMQVTVPAGVSGSQNVTVQVGSQTSDPSPYEVVPVIASLDASSGIIGSSLTINGSGFSATAADNTIRFGSTAVAAANITVNGDGTQLTAVVPAGISGSQPVTVQVGNRTSAPSAFNVTPVLNALAVSAASPDTTNFVLSGTGFSSTPANNNVSFGGTPATVTSATATQLQVTVPNVYGSMNLNVTVAGQTSGNRTFESIPTITGITPTATGSAGDSIVLNGKGFDPDTMGNNGVQLGGVDATVTAATATSVTVSVPETPAKTANATVQVGNQTSSAESFNILPRLATLSTAEAVSGKAVLIRSAVLTISGSNFDPVKANNTVTFSLSDSSSATVPGSSADVISASATEIQVRVPAAVNVTGDVSIKVSTNSNESNALTGFVPTVTLNINDGGFH